MQYHIVPTDYQILCVNDNGEVYSWACLVYKSTAQNWSLHLYDPSRAAAKRIEIETADPAAGKWLITEPIELSKYGNRHITRYNDGRHALFAFDTDDQNTVFYVKELAFFKSYEDAKVWINDADGVPHPIKPHTSISLETEQSLSENGMLYRHFEHEKTGTWHFDKSERALAVTYMKDYYRHGEYVVGNWRLAPRFVSSKSNMLYLNPRHEHNKYEISIITEGKAEITCGSKIYELDKGYIVFIPKNYTHLYRSVGEVPLQMVTVHFLIPDIEKIGSKSIAMDKNETELLDIICRDMSASFGVMQNDSPVEMTATAKKLFEVFFEYVMNSISLNSNIEKTDTIIFKKAVQYMNTNIHRKLNVREIATACITCKTKLTDVFNMYTQMSCMKYFINLKMERARQLIISGKSCAEAAEMLGFSSQAYFSKCFKLYFGVVPSNIVKTL